MVDERASVRRGRRKLILVFLLFFGPALLAWLLILSGWRPAGTVNHGTLMQPPVPIAELPLAAADEGPVTSKDFVGRWNLLLVVESACDDACLRALDQLVRVRIALNKNADRVQLMLVLPPAAHAERPPGVRLLRLPRQAVDELLAETAASNRAAVHMVDPHGFRMMAYPAPLDAQGLLKDLRRLLRLSDEQLERLQRIDRDRQ